MVIVFGAVVLQPHRIVVAAVALGDGPGSRKGVVNDGDLVVERVRVRLVEIEALLDDGLAILMKRHTSAFVSARSLKAACLDLQQIVTTVAMGIDPSADRVAEEGRLDLLRPVAAIGNDVP